MKRARTTPVQAFDLQYKPIRAEKGAGFRSGPFRNRGTGASVPDPGGFYTFPAMRLAIAFLALVLFACGDWKQDPDALVARGAPAMGPGCASCHNYPPRDSNHLYHLYVAVGNKYDNGRITCLDCHRTSIQAREVVLRDTLFLNPETEPSFHITESSLDRPVRSPADSFAILIRSWQVDAIREIRQFHPIPQGGRPLPDSGLVDFMTGLAHLNGSVDVVFDTTYNDPDRFGGQAALYRPTQETCSAVSCHPTDGPYRFAAPSKGLEGLK